MWASVWSVYGWDTKSASVKTNQKRVSAAQGGSEHGNLINKRRRQPSTGQTKDKHIGRFKLFLDKNQYGARIFKYA